MDAVEIETDVVARAVWPARRKLSVSEYHLMGEIGMLRREERVELIEGAIIQMAAIGSGHYGAVIRINRFLIRAVGDRAMVGVQGPVQLDRYNEPQPDFSLLRPRADNYAIRLPMPEDVLLLIETADSSLAYDRNVKVPLYASHMIPEYWIVNLREHVVEFFRAPNDGAFTQTGRAGRDESLSPLLLPDIEIPVRVLLG